LFPFPLVSSLPFDELSNRMDPSGQVMFFHLKVLVRSFASSLISQTHCFLLIAVFHLQNQIPRHRNTKSSIILHGSFSICSSLVHPFPIKISRIPADYTSNCCLHNKHTCVFLFYQHFPFFKN